MLSPYSAVQVTKEDLLINCLYKQKFPRMLFSRFCTASSTVSNRKEDKGDDLCCGMAKTLIQCPAEASSHIYISYNTVVLYIGIIKVRDFLP